MGAKSKTALHKNFPFHHKISAAGNEAVGAWLRMLSWSNDQNTGGAIPMAIVSAITVDTPGATDKLLTSRLLDVAPGGYAIHNYAKYAAPVAAPARARQRRSRGPSAVAGVYFIQADGEGPIKIGCSSDVDARVARLQTGFSGTLRILAVSTGCMADEQDLHRRFAHVRVRGEWFSPAPELLALIGEITGAAR